MPTSITSTGITFPDASTQTTAAGYTDADALTLFNASGSAPVYACRAWVNFNGTGTVAIRASGNVSSITDNGTGQYTVNFTTAMQDANYVLVCSATNNGYNTGTFHATPTSTYTTTAVQVIATGISGSTNVNIDVTRGCVAIFR